MVKKIKYYNNFKVLLQDRNSILLIGNFDGLHVGHQKLFNLAKTYKKKYRLKIGVVTFDPMPKMFFNKNIKNFRISSPNQKKMILKKNGIDFIINKRFDKKFSKIKYYDFIKNILHKKLSAKYIFVSSNFRFGNKREGNVKKLIQSQKAYGFKIIKPQPLKKNHQVISSSLIRKLLEKGQLARANKFLSRNWCIEGFVEKGRQLGQKIGFPTCNIDIKNYVIAKPGVYAVNVYQKNSLSCLKGIANIGYRPTFNQKKILLEVHIFNFSGNLYNKHLTVEFKKFIRKEQKFKNVNQLKKQINLDLTIAKKI